MPAEQLNDQLKNQLKINATECNENPTQRTIKN
jgi:hypothetical protein